MRYGENGAFFFLFAKVLYHPAAALSSTFSQKIYPAAQKCATVPKGRHVRAFFIFHFSVFSFLRSGIMRKPLYPASYARGQIMSEGIVIAKYKSI